MMSRAASEVGAAAEVTRGEPAEGEGAWAALWAAETLLRSSRFLLVQNTKLGAC